MPNSNHKRQQFRARNIPCPYTGCSHLFVRSSGPALRPVHIERNNFAGRPHVTPATSDVSRDADALATSSCSTPTPSSPGVDLEAHIGSSEAHAGPWTEDSMFYVIEYVRSTHRDTIIGTPCDADPGVDLEAHAGLSKVHAGPLEVHIGLSEAHAGPWTEYHTLLDGTPCDADGYDLPDGTPPEPRPPIAEGYEPYESRGEFELTDFLFQKEQMSGVKIDTLMQIWAAINAGKSSSDLLDPLFASADDLYSFIDAMPYGEIGWESFTVSYNGPRPEHDPPPWMLESYEVWFQCPRKVLYQQLGNPDFAHEMDYAPKRVFNKDGKRVYSDLMSGNWAWKQADTIARDPKTHGSVFCPVILGSDKTTVSVATGQNEYYPLYLSNGLVSNAVRCARRNAVTVVAFLAIPKTDREFQDDPRFRKFRRQLFHASLNQILSSLRPGMTTPEVVRFGDQHLRRVIYGLGPYIADYPEQALLACIVQGWCARCTASANNLDGSEGIHRSHEHTVALLRALDAKKLWEDYGVVGDLIPFTVNFPRADIHELLAPDLLHQVIKGTFKDHLVMWVEQYLEATHGKTRAAAILADIDRRIAAAPPFPGLRRFPQGRGFKQWTGDDSKALMKVYLPAIAGHVPSQMVHALSAFLEFCYLVRHSVIDEDTLVAIDTALEDFHRERTIFEATGIRADGFSLPRQHALKHYRHLVQEFGAPNGICFLITESKHIKAVKEPWRRSNRYEALGQILLTNQRLDKMAAARVDFAARGMLDGPLIKPTSSGSHHVTEEGDGSESEDGDEEEVRGYPTLTIDLASYIGVPELPDMIRRFLYDQLAPHGEVSLDDVPISSCPQLPLRVSVYPSAVATFYAPSDLSGVGGMHRERIRAVRSWKRGPPHHDCAFTVADPGHEGFQGLHVVRIMHFLLFKHDGVEYPYALVTGFSPISNRPCEDTRMWIVTPDVDSNGRQQMQLMHIDCLLRGAHLMGVAGEEMIPRDFRYTNTLDAFQAFYVNKYVDHQAHELAF
ncbi:hypothetical protein OBBRIDRAFT_850015 [Obba rivulosa]|uniref:Uncharacterized protein n=1 Tax=Obba rivulosa TaxID=1052685 RepID=A0A8E2ANB7_9APHY|nr:hypothetical protein OBBRIDRAFT_850015 [Obba rivulosa]